MPSSLPRIISSVSWYLHEKSMAKYERVRTYLLYLKMQNSGGLVPVPRYSRSA